MSCPVSVTRMRSHVWSHVSHLGHVPLRGSYVWCIVCYVDVHHVAVMSCYHCVVSSCVVVPSCDAVVPSCVVVPSCDAVVLSCDAVVLSCDVVVPSCDAFVLSFDAVVPSCDAVVTSCDAGCAVM